MSDIEYDQLITEMGEGGVSKHGYHSFHDFLQCPKKYQYSKVRGLRKPQRAVPDYFATGTMCHGGRAVFLAAGSRLDTDVVNAVLAAVQKAADDSPLPVSDKARKDAARWMTEYMDHYGTQRAPRSIATEYLVECHFNHKGQNVPLTARLDDVSFYDELRGALAIGEAKTTSASVDACVNQYRLHPQPVLQQVLYNHAPNGSAVFGPVVGTILDVMVKGYNGKKCQFARVPLEWPGRIQQEMREWLVARKAQAQLMQWDDQAERHFARCTDMHGSMRVTCDYRPLCLDGRDAATQYVTKEGSYLHMHEGTERMKPWE